MLYYAIRLLHRGGGGSVVHYRKTSALSALHHVHILAKSQRPMLLIYWIV